jgi:hypothetical protein
VRVLALLLVVAACDLQPPKKKEAPPPPPPPKVMIDAGAVAPVADAAVAVAADAPVVVDAAPVVVTADGDIEPTQECLDVGVHIADVLIEDEKDATKKAALEQDKTNIVKISSRRCTKDGWSEPIRKCFNASRTGPQIEMCAKRVPQPK